MYFQSFKEESYSEIKNRDLGVLNPLMRRQEQDKSQ